MKKKLPIILSVLITLFQSCEYVPYRGIQPRTITSTRSSTESKALGAYMAQYTPIDTLVEYHDSLIDIKFNITEAYLETEFREIYRFPPYRKKHYRLYPMYSFVIIVDLDSVSTVNIPHSCSWWEISDLQLNRTVRNVPVRVEKLAMTSLHPQLDTIEIPLYFGWSYRNRVWPGNHYEEVLIQKMRFVLDDTNFHGNVFTYSSASQKLQDKFEFKKKTSYVWGHRTRSTSQMDSIYPRHYNDTNAQ